MAKKNKPYDYYVEHAELISFDKGNIVEYIPEEEGETNYLVLVTGFKKDPNTSERLFLGVILTEGTNDYEKPGRYGDLFIVKCFKKFIGKLTIQQS